MRFKEIYCTIDESVIFEFHTEDDRDAFISSARLPNPELLVHLDRDDGDGEIKLELLCSESDYCTKRHERISHPPIAYS